MRQLTHASWLAIHSRLILATRQEILSNLGTALYNRFGILGNLDDLDAAIAAGERALAAGPAQTRTRRSHIKSGLLRSLKRFELTGDISDLETAVRIRREALDAGPEGLLA